MQYADYDTRVAGYAVIIDADNRVLLSWYNGLGRGAQAGWTLPGGGVDFAESIEDAIAREVREETGYEIALGPPLLTHSFTTPNGPRPPRPLKSVRIVYAAEITGGQLGTLEVGGTTDRAVWMPIADALSAESRADIVDYGLAARAGRGESESGGLHPLLATRLSPVRFDGNYEVSDADVSSILDAARWSPSAGNSQPWAFIVGRRGDDTHARLVRHLAPSSAPWASTASLLLANLSHRYVADTDWEYSEFSLYDLGQAVAHMTVQAQSLGLSTRQFRAFDRDALAADFAVPAHWEVSTMSAVGRPAAGAVVDPPDAAGRSRRRRPVEQLLWPSADDVPRS